MEIDKNASYVKCTVCGDLVRIDKEMFARIIGGTTAGFGFTAWVTFLFAGTGFALPLCVAIMAGGGAILAGSKEVAKWLSKQYPCPNCGAHTWTVVNGDAIISARVKELIAASEIATVEGGYEETIEKFSDALARYRAMEKVLQKALAELRKQYDNMMANYENMLAETRLRESELAEQLEELRKEAAMAKNETAEMRQRHEAAIRKLEDKLTFQTNLVKTTQSQMETAKNNYRQQIKELKKAHQTEIKLYKNKISQQDITIGALNKKIIALRDSYDKQIAELEKDKSNTILDLRALHDKFWEGLRDCRREFDVHVPTLGYVFNMKEFSAYVISALERGVVVKIRHGMDDRYEKADFDKMVRNKKDFINKIKRYNPNLLKNLHFKRDYSHTKLVLVDDDFYILSSMNFLSYSGQGIVIKGEFRDAWEELGEMSDDKHNLREYRKMYFNFEGGLETDFVFEGKQ